MESNLSGFQRLIFSSSIGLNVMLKFWQVYCLVFTGWIIHDLFLGSAIFRAQQNPPSKRGVLDGDGIMTWFKSLARSDEMRALSLLSSDILRSPTTHNGVQRVFEVALYLFLMFCIPSTYNVSLDSLKRESSKIWNVTFQFSSANEIVNELPKSSV